jgi:hypothetical protein
MLPVWHWPGYSACPLHINGAEGTQDFCCTQMQSLVLVVKQDFPWAMGTSHKKVHLHDLSV